MSQPLKGSRFDLADALAGQSVVLTDLFHRLWRSAPHSKSPFYDVAISNL
jgi:hypothetical protein